MPGSGAAGPNLGLFYGWLAHEAGWGDGFNNNFAELDAITFLEIKSAILTAPPGSPAAGDRYVVGASPSGAWSGHSKDLAIYRNSAWSFYTPKAGWRAYNEATSAYTRFDGTNWVAETTGEASTLVLTRNGALSDFHWEGLTGFDTYRLTGRVAPGTNNTDLRLTFGTGGGPTYASSGYRHAIVFLGSGGFTTDTNFGESEANIPFALGVANTIGGVKLDWLIETDNSTFVSINGTQVMRSNDGHTYTNTIGAEVAIGAALTGIKIAPASGSLAAASKLSLYSLNQ